MQIFMEKSQTKKRLNKELLGRGYVLVGDQYFKRYMIGKMKQNISSNRSNR